MGCRLTHAVEMTDPGSGIGMRDRDPGSGSGSDLRVGDHGEVRGGRRAQRLDDQPQLLQVVATGEEGLPYEEVA